MAILVESEVHLSFLPIPNSLGVRFLIRRLPPDASVTQFPKTQKFVPYPHENRYIFTLVA